MRFDIEAPQRQEALNANLGSSSPCQGNYDSFPIWIGLHSVTSVGAAFCEGAAGKL